MDNTKQDKYLHVFLCILIVVILIFPKINLFSIPGSRTGIRIDDILVAIYFVLLLYRIKKGKMTFSKPVKTLLILFFSYFLMNLLSSLLNSASGNVGFVTSLLHVIRKLEYFVFFFAGIDFYKTSAYSGRKSIVKILNVIFWFHVIYSILEYSNIIGSIGDLIGRPATDRIYTTFSGPYEFSAFFAIMACFYIVRIIKSKSYVSVFFLAICIVEILISQSRISLLAVFFVFFVAILYYIKDKKKIIQFVSFMGIVTIIGICIISYSSNDVFKRFKQLDISSSMSTMLMAWENADYKYYQETGSPKYTQEILVSSSDLSYVIRISKWMTLLKETLKNPIFGLGPSIVGEGMDGNFVRILCESGLFGIIAWIVLLIYIIKQTYKTNHMFIDFVFFGILSMCVIAIFIDIFEASKIMSIYWLLFGIAMTLKYETKEKKQWKIVHVLDGVNFGGVEAVLYNYFSNMKGHDFENVIVSHSPINLDNRKKLEKIHINIFYEVTPKRKNMIKNFYDLLKVYWRENPDILHVHMTSSSYIALLAGMILGVDVRICHAHSYSKDVSQKQKLMNFLCTMFANEYWACSEVAGKYLFGIKKYNKGKIFILNNAIELGRFDFNSRIRNKIRSQYKIDNKVVVGHVGRFEIEKNHERLIKIFGEYKQKNPQAFLLLIGDGGLKEKIIEHIKINNLQNDVLVLDAIGDIEAYYNAMDVFVFPSLYEGLGMVLIEAQVSGLPCIASSNIPNQVKLTDNVFFVDLNKSDEEWVKTIDSGLDLKRESKLKILKNSDYNIYSQVEKLRSKYINLIQK